MSKRRNLKVIDATCPLVTKVHIEAVKFAKQGYSLVLIGHRDHDEIEGTLGEAPEVTQVVSNAAEVDALEVPDPNRVAYLTQTTLSLDEARDIIHALKLKFPNIVGPHSQDICYATENRQVAVRNVAHDAGLVLVVGSTNSSNSNRLVEVSRNLGTIGYLIDNSEAIDPVWLEGVANVAVTAGASAPEILVEDVVNYLRLNGFSSVEEVEVMPENVRFGLASGDCASHWRRRRERASASKAMRLRGKERQATGHAGQGARQTAGIGRVLERSGQELRRFRPHESKTSEGTIRGGAGVCPAAFRPHRCRPGRCRVVDIERAGVPSILAASRRLLVRRAGSRLHARSRLHFSAHASGIGRSGKAEARLHGDDALPERGRELEHLSRRTGQHLAFGEVLFFRQADGHRRGRSAARDLPRVDPGPWRRGGVQHLHQDVSVFAGAIRLRRRARHSAGDCPFSQLVLLQSLRDLGVVAVDSCAAGDYLRQEAVQEDCARAEHRRAVRGRTGQLHSARAHGSQGDLFMAEFLPDPGQDYALGGGGSHPAAAAAGTAQSGKMDAGAARDDGRSGRDLSGHAERHPGAALPGLLGGRSAGDSRPRRV